MTGTLEATFFFAPAPAHHPTKRGDRGRELTAADDIQAVGLADDTAGSSRIHADDQRKLLT